MEADKEMSRLKSELEELTRAIEDLVNVYKIDDFVYDVRERVSEDSWFKDNPGASSWDHPKVKRYTQCMEILRRSIQ